MKDRDSIMETGLLKMELKGIPRRTFIKYCAATAVALGLDYYFGGLFAEAATTALNKKPVIRPPGCKKGFQVICGLFAGKIFR